MNFFILIGMFFSMLFLSYFHIMGASITSIISMIALAYLFFFGKIKFSEKTLSAPICYIILLSLPVAIFLVIVDWHNLFIVSKLLLMPLLVLIILSMLIEDMDTLETLKKVLIIFLSIDVVFALLQFFDLDFAWKVRAMLQSLSSDYDVRVMYAIESREHPLGLGYQSITFSYHMLLFFSLTFSNLIEGKKNIWNQTFFLLASTGLFLSFSMSSIGGAVLTSIFLVFRKNKIPGYNVSFFVLFGALIILLIFLVKRDFNFVSALSRIPHFYAGLNVFLDNYIYGLQGSEYTTLARPYLEKFADVPKYVFDEAVHNSYLLAILKLGGLAMVLIFFLIYLIAKLCQTVERGFSKGRYFYSLYFPSYFMTCFFHNAGPYTGDHLFWVVVGFLIITTSFDIGNRNEAYR